MTNSILNSKRQRNRASLYTALIVCLWLLAGCVSSPYHVANDSMLQLYKGNNKPTIVVDIDGTIIEQGTFSSLKMMFPSMASYENVQPIKDAPLALGALMEKWNIILLTAQTDWYEKGTLKWMEVHKFPQVPVIFSTESLPELVQRAHYKKLVIKDLKGLGINVQYGIGDRNYDIAAYNSAGLKSIILVDGPDDEDLKKTMRALGIVTLPSKRLLVLFTQQDAWRQILHHLAEKELPVPAPVAPAPVLPPIEE